MDGLPYKVATVIYNLMALSFLWFIFSIPIITIGASTTALFYVVGKIIRGENYELYKGFWKSFRLNFKQATIIWLIMIFTAYLLFTNIIGVRALQLGKFFLYMQYILFVELLIIFIYIFPILSRYHMTVFNCFKMSIYIGNRHLLTSFLCMMVFPGMYYLLAWKSLTIIFLAAIYAFWITYLLKDKLELYAKKEEESEKEEKEE
jgi:uncharacterized membrane protein YesL